MNIENILRQWAEDREIKRSIEHAKRTIGLKGDKYHKILWEIIPYVPQEQKDLLYEWECSFETMSSFTAAMKRIFGKI